MTKPKGKTIAGKRAKVLRLAQPTPKLISNGHAPASKDSPRAERELDRLRESLVRQERMRAIGELAAGVAHDLNNTLHAMSLRLSLIEQSPVCQAAQGDNIGALSRIISDA